MALNSRYGRRILARRIGEQQGRCCYCRRRFAAQGLLRATLEHRRPKRDGGSDRVANLAAACLHCNRHRARQIERDRLGAKRERESRRSAPSEDQP